MSGPRLGRKASDLDLAEAEKKVEYRDNTDRIAVERLLSLGKRRYKMGLVMEYLDDTGHTAVSLSVLTTNLFKILEAVPSLFCLFIGKCKTSRFSVRKPFHRRLEWPNIHRKCIMIKKYSL